MESQTSLIWSDCAVHPYPVSSVYLYLPLVIHPGNPEHNYPFGFRNSFQDSSLTILRIPVQYRLNTFQDLFYSLMKFLFTRISVLYYSQNV